MGTFPNITIATGKADATATATDHPAHHNTLADELNTAGVYMLEHPIKEVAGASTANVTGTYANGTAGVGATKAVGGTTLTVDGVALANGNRLLLKDQTTAFENGIYVVSGIGSSVVLTRTTDADTQTKLADCEVSVAAGTINQDSKWRCASTTITVGTTALGFRRTMPIYGHGNPRFPWDIAAPTTQVITTTIPRAIAISTFSLSTSAIQYLFGGCVVPAGRTITNINYVATTAGGTTTVDWFSLGRQSDRLTMAHTANTTTVPTINVVTTRALTAPWTPNYDTPVWIVWSLTIASTARVVVASPAGTAAVNLLTPAMSGNNGFIPSAGALPIDNSTTVNATTIGAASIPYLWLT